MKNWQKLTLVGVALVAVVGGTRAAGLWGIVGTAMIRHFAFHYQHH
ncbi:Uncharacterised protein [Leuconostoc mesenteroides]|nr:Uncharacterised protein [Leuconostoc mesenteroides]